MNVRRARASAVLAVAVLTAACSGPVAPLDVGSKEVPLDLLLGEKVKQVAQAPVPPLLVDAPIRFFGAPFAPQGGGGPTPSSFTSSTTPPVDPGPCPAAHPLAAPKLVAPPNVPGPPKPATYLFRTRGVLKTGSTNVSEVVLAAQSQVTVKDVAPEAGDGFVFSVSVSNQPVGTTTTTYRVVRSPAPAVDPPPNDPHIPRPAGATSALYVSGIVQEGARVAFRPAFPGIPLTRLPFVNGATFEAAGSDGVTTVSWRSTVKGTARVDACGTPLQAHVVELSNGRITGGERGEVATFTSTLAIASQYGGLPIQVATVTQGTMAPDVAVHRTVELTANQEPAAS